MTITPISNKISRVLPDEGRLLRISGDDHTYSEIVCESRMIPKITEVDA